MAYVPTNTSLDEDEQNNLGTSPDASSSAEPTESAAPAGSAPGSTSTQTGGGGATPANNTAATPSQTTGGVRPTGTSQISQQTGFTTGAEPYVNSTANQDAIAGTSTGIASDLNTATGQTTSAIKAGTTNLKGDVNAGAPSVNTGVNNDIINNPTDVSATDKSTLTNELSGTYKGPTDSTSYFTSANTPAATAAGKAEVLEQPDIAGPQTYFSGSGVQGQGNQTLDAALFTGSKKAQDAVRPAVLKAQAAPTDVSGAIAEGNNVIVPGGQTKATATQTTTENALTAGEAGYVKQGNSAAANDITEYNKLAQTTTSFLQNPVEITGTPTADQTSALSALGYTPAQWNTLVQAYNNLAQLQYVQNLVKQSGFVITQDPTTGKFINQATGDEVVFPSKLPPPAGIDLSKGLTVQEASQLFNMGNAANPKTLADISALEGLLGQSGTVAANPTGANGTQFAYAPPDLSTNLTAAQTALTQQNNLAEVAIHNAEANPSAALKSGTNIGIAYAIGGAALAMQVATAGVKTALGQSGTLATALGNSAANLATTAGASDAVANGVGAGAAAVGEALSVIGAVYGIYNFIAGYQSGNSAADALNGAEAGASIGSLFGPIGTLVGAVIGAVVGAISGLFGYKKDPEQAYWSSYQSSAIQNFGYDPSKYVTLDAAYVPPSEMIQFAMGDPSPATTFEGLMDGHYDGNTGMPIFNHYGRMGGGTFIKDMTTQIDQAASAGQINYYSTPQQIYSKVIAPWIAKMGSWSNPNSPVIISLIIAMIGQYTSGNVSSWQWINGTNYLQQQTKPFSQFVSDAYAPSSFYSPPTTGNTTSNPIAYANGPAPTQVANPAGP